MPRPVPSHRPGSTLSTLLLFLLLVGLFAAPLRAETALATLEDKVEVLVLENGMKFFLVHRGEAPVFHGLLRFEVGGVDEVPGISGIAHLFEHMAFKGTTRIGTRDHAGEKKVLEAIDRVAREYSAELARWDRADPDTMKVLKAQLEVLQKLHKDYVVKDEFTRIYNRSGAQGLNASTSKDVTTYYVSLPANRLELWMLMESERLLHPVLREFYSERDVVQEERRMRVDDRPGGKLYEEFLSTAITAHPYRLPTVGWASDIATVTKEDAQAFYDAYYSPQNGVGALVGNFDVERAKQLLRQYFGRLENKGEIRRPTTREPEQKSERRVDVYFDAQPDLMMGWHKPTFPHPDEYVFDVLDVLLSGGRTSLLYERLVKARKAQGVWTYAVPGSRYPNVFTISATPLAGHTLEEMETEIEAELARLKEELVDPRDLQKVLNQVEASFIRSLKSNAGLASRLTFFEVVADDWTLMMRYLEELRKVTPERIREVVRKYFIRTNRTVAQLLPRSRLSGEEGE